MSHDAEHLVEYFSVNVGVFSVNTRPSGKVTDLHLPHVMSQAGRAEKASGMKTLILTRRTGSRKSMPQRLILNVEM